MSVPVPGAGWQVLPMRYDDAARAADMANAAARLFGRGPVFSAEEFLGMLRMPSVDPERDGRLVLDASGALVATVGSLMSEPWTTAQVMPSVGDHPRRPELLALVLDVGIRLALARPEAADRAVVEVGVPEEDTAWCQLLQGAGFTAVRRSAEMLRTLDDLSDLPVRQPDGVSLVTLDADDDALLLELAALQREAFADHDGDYALTDDDFVAFIRQMPTIRPDLSVVAVEGGAPVGLAVSIADVIDATGRTGYVALVGVARRGRGRGVATAMLAECFRRYREVGWRTARLHVQVGNRTGADRLYRAVGMSPRFVDLTYERSLR